MVKATNPYQKNKKRAPPPPPKNVPPPPENDESESEIDKKQNVPPPPKFIRRKSSSNTLSTMSVEKKGRHSKQEEISSDDESYESNTDSCYETDDTTDDDRPKKSAIIIAITGNSDGSDTESDLSQSENEDEIVSSDSETSNDDESVVLPPPKHAVLDTLRNLKPDSITSKCIELCEKEISVSMRKQQKKEAKQSEKHKRIFTRLNRDQHVDLRKYFAKLPLDEQRKYIKQLREINKSINLEKPLKIAIMDSELPSDLKAIAINKINTLALMEKGNDAEEEIKLKQWIDTFMKIPFGKYSQMPPELNESGPAKFLAKAKYELDGIVFGLNDVKSQLLQFLGQRIVNPKSTGNCIGICGPPGVGKTALFQQGLAAKVLNRPCATFALGGATDSSTFEGHHYTYIGSQQGQLVDGLIKGGVMDMLFLFDEIDKISHNSKGDEIVGILMHLTDSTQNAQFCDKYFSEFKIDFSSSIMVFTYNDESLINKILLDRMYKLKCEGYTIADKLVIARDFLLPKIRDQFKFAESDITIPNETIKRIDALYCDGEKGVRNLKRNLETIFAKLNLCRLDAGATIGLNTEIKFPFVVREDMLREFIKVPPRDANPLYV